MSSTARDSRASDAADARESVLLVDDEPAVLVALARALRREPYRILTAGSGVEALATLRSRPVDVIVSDERMPSMSGSELLSQVRHEFPEVVRLMLTGEATLEASVRAIHEGLYRFLYKPLNPDELAGTLRQALHMKHVSAIARVHASAAASPPLPFKR